MNRRYINYFLLLLLLTDLTYSFYQHYSMPLDGDLAGGIVPAEEVKVIFKDPLGISVITDNAVYPNPNRYFAQWTFYKYFNSVPLWLQNFVDPIDSVYLACAIAKIFIQILILTLLSFYITGRKKIHINDFLIAALLIIPLFQTNGYRSYMGIIDPSITYTFFYALPSSILLLFYLPFYFDSVYATDLMKNWIVKIFIFALSIYVVFSGALNPGIILTITLLYGLKSYSMTDKNLSIDKRALHTLQLIPKTYLFFFSLISLMSLYALYIGKNNSIFIGETISISERYSRIPKGLFTILTQKIGFPLILIVIAINIYLIRKNIKDGEIINSIRVFSWIGLFAFIYILLLPLGGYKEYRPNILRYDTMMPITLGLIFIYAFSSYQLIRYFNGKSKYYYLTLIVSFALVFTNADKLELNKNACEKSALGKISKSNDKVVFIDNDCTVLSWDKMTDSTKSVLNGKLLQIWNITTDNKKYYQIE